ncbi:antitoxin family protein [Geoglobus acetivorans]|uniref:Antitoxin n=1 Tax=Geoglobus acetivorans TaxID=565033 RepID=A0A0A7GBX9_GEOAI|nr:hypothetical protein GACE_0507 [Geoglobus acetivorans]
MPKVIEVIYENGVFKPLGKLELPEGAKLLVFVEDFSEIDSISIRTKEIAGEASGKKILEVLGDVWM